MLKQLFVHLTEKKPDLIFIFKMFIFSRYFLIITVPLSIVGQLFAIHLSHRLSFFLVYYVHLCYTVKVLNLFLFK